MCVCLSFSDIVIRMITPADTQLPEALVAFQCDDPGVVDAEFEICLIHTPLPTGMFIARGDMGVDTYRTEEGWLRVCRPLIEADGCQVACLITPSGKNKLFYPAAKWDLYRAPLKCMHLLGIEILLIHKQAFLLHSSVVHINGKAVLFTGPSGAGKSTQAGLWEKYLGAKVINGDRCVVMKKEDSFYGGGSPWSGSSGIYHPDQAPIAGIFLLNQAADNRITPMARDAFIPLFSQTVVNSWDSEFMDRISLLFSDLIGQVPIYRLDCRPDEDAVMTAYHSLFK